MVPVSEKTILVRLKWHSRSPQVALLNQFFAKCQFVFVISELGIAKNRMKFAKNSFHSITFAV
jgi:hypothetical protein